MDRCSTTQDGLSAQMMRAYRMAVSNDGYLRVVNPQPLVEEVFRFTKLHTLIGIFPTVDEAIAAE